MVRMTALLVLTMATGVALAHHSQAGLFDSKAKVEINGVVTQVSWRNPHGQILLDVSDANGNVTEWDAETASISKCGTKGQPLIMITPLPIDFVRVGDTIELRIEEYDSLRVVHMNEDAVAPAEHTLMGFHAAISRRTCSSSRPITSRRATSTTKACR